MLRRAAGHTGLVMCLDAELGHLEPRALATRRGASDTRPSIAERARAISGDGQAITLPLTARAEFERARDGSRRGRGSDTPTPRSRSFCHRSAVHVLDATDRTERRV
jgi:hypothetical protein